MISQCSTEDNCTSAVLDYRILSFDSFDVSVLAGAAARQVVDQSASKVGAGEQEVVSRLICVQHDTVQVLLENGYALVWSAPWSIRPVFRRFGPHRFMHRVRGGGQYLSCRGVHYCSFDLSARQPLMRFNLVRRA